MDKSFWYGISFKYNKKWEYQNESMLKGEIRVKNYKNKVVTLSREDISTKKET